MIYSIDGWQRPKRIPMMCRDETYDITPGVHPVVGSWDYTTSRDLGYKYELLTTTRTPIRLTLDAKAGHSYKLIGGKNFLLPGFTKPQIIDLTTKGE